MSFQQPNTTEHGWHRWGGYKG